MKNFIKLFAVVLVAAFFCVSCLEKGGTIMVTNNYNGDNFVLVIKGELTSLPDIDLQRNGTLIGKNQTKSFNFDDDGAYTVAYFFPSPGFKMPPVILLAGNTVKVTVP